MSDKEGEVELRALESLMESIQAMDGNVEGSEGGDEHPPAEFQPFDELGHDWNQVEPSQESHDALPEHGERESGEQEPRDTEQEQNGEQQQQEQHQESQEDQEIDLSGLLANVQTLMGGDSLEGLWNVEEEQQEQQEQQEEKQVEETREEGQEQVQEEEHTREQSERVEEAHDTQGPSEQRVDASETNNDDDSEMFSLPEGLAELTETLKGLPQELGQQLQESGAEEHTEPDQDALAALTEAINAHAQSQSQQEAENVETQAQEAAEADKPVSPAPESASEPFETSHEQFQVPEKAETGTEEPAPPTEESAVAQPSEDDISLAVTALHDAISASNVHEQEQQEEPSRPDESEKSEDKDQVAQQDAQQDDQQEVSHAEPQTQQEEPKESQEESQPQPQEQQEESQEQNHEAKDQDSSLGGLGDLGIEATLEAALGAVNDAVMKQGEQESPARHEEPAHEPERQEHESFPQDFQFEGSADDLAELRRTLESEVAAATEQQEREQEQQHRQSQPPLEHIDPSLQGSNDDTSMIDPGLMGQGETDKGKEPAEAAESTEGFNLDFGDIEKLITQSLNEKRRESINKRKESISDITWQQLQQHLHGLQQGEESAVYDDDLPAEQVPQPRQRQTQPRSRPVFAPRRPRSPQPDHEQQLKQQMHQFQIERPAQSASSQSSQPSSSQPSSQVGAIAPAQHFQQASSSSSQTPAAQPQQQTEEEPINEILMNALAMAMNEDGTEEPQHRPLPDQGQIDFTKFDGLEPEESGENLSLDQESSAALLETLISSGVNVDQSFLDQLSSSAGKGDSSQMAVDTLRQKRAADSMIEPSGAQKRFRNNNNNNNNVVAAQDDGEDPILAAFLLAKQVISQTQQDEDDDVSPDAIEAIQAALDSLGPPEGYPYSLRRKSQGFSEQHREEIREANRNRKKQWRVINSDRNKDNDLRCRVHKRATVKFGPEDSDEKSKWIDEEYTKRRRKRLERSEMAERNRQSEQFLPGAEHLRTLLESLGENDALENFNNAISSLIKDPKLLQEVTAKVNEGGKVLNGSLEGIAGLLTVNLNGHNNGGVPRPGLNTAGGGKILSFKLDHHNNAPSSDIALEAANKPIFNIHEPVKEPLNLNSMGSSSSQPFLPLSPVMEPIMPPPKPKPPKPTKKVEDMTMEERLEYIMQTDPEDRVDLKEDEVPPVETFVDPKFEKQLAAITGDVGAVNLGAHRPPPITQPAAEHRPPPFWGKTPSGNSPSLGHMGGPAPAVFKNHLFGGDKDTPIIKPPQYSVPSKPRAGGVAGALASRMEDKKAASLGFPPLLAAFRDKME